MKNKRHNKLNSGILFLLLPVFLCFFFTACPEPLYLDRHSGGQGYFSYSQDEDSAKSRTILPETITSDFKIFSFEFFASGAAVNPVLSIDKTYSNLTDPVALNAGVWDLRITAYFDDLKTLPAAWGILNNIVITSGQLTSKNVSLFPFSDPDSEGVFSWDIDYPASVDTAYISITPLFAADMNQMQYYFTGPLKSAHKKDSIPLMTGHYRFTVVLRSSANALRAVRTDVLHIYKNMESVFEFVFTDEHFVKDIVVSSPRDSGAGSLREALDLAADNSRIVIDSSLGAITLLSGLPYINKNLEIEGNGVIITTGEEIYDSLFNIWEGTVIIRGIWFKDCVFSGWANSINISDGTLILESCIFSGAEGGREGSAITNYGADVIVNGCTFIYNKALDEGGAIYVNYSAANLTLAGNIFYGNTAQDGPSVFNYDGRGIITSNGYNVSDTPIVAGGNFYAHPTDRQSAAGMFTTLDAKIISGSGADFTIPLLPADYPSYDFYGKPVTAPAMPGAIQEKVISSGFYLGLSVNDSERGSISVTQGSGSGGFYTGSVTIAAEAKDEYRLLYWNVNGIYRSNLNLLVLTLTEHTLVQAVFGNVVTVTSDADDGEGTLRQAVLDAQKDDVISIELSAPNNIISLESRLVIDKNTVIEGNGIIITTSIPSYVSLLRIDANVRISRVWFKDIRPYYADGSAIFTSNGVNLILESCIFSGCGAVYTGERGGAIYGNYSTLDIRGCTFYDNNNGEGGAVYSYYGSVILTGNIFYGNTALSGDAVYMYRGMVSSNGYNISDVPLAAVSGGSFFSHSSDVVSSKPFLYQDLKVLSGGVADNVVTVKPDAYPAMDFYGMPISIPAASGAIQERKSGSGLYYLVLSVNNSDKGTISLTQPAISPDSFYTGNVTITASPSSENQLLSWVVNGTNRVNTNPLVLTLTEHTVVQAVFGEEITVTSDQDYFSWDTPIQGTLRYAVNNAQDGDVINISLPQGSAIELLNGFDIKKNITINGNGVTILQSDDSYYNHFSIYNESTATIKRIWFKGLKDSPIRNTKGNLTLESCIFSGNGKDIYEAGAVHSSAGTLNIKGCTFYGNTAKSKGGAIYIWEAGLTLTGNIFYGNTAREGPSVCNDGGYGTVISNGYNVCDTPLVEGGSFNAHSTDKVTQNIYITQDMKILSGTEADNNITSIPSGYPAFDFYNTPITASAASGAVQARVSGSGYYLMLNVNNETRGTVLITSPSADSFYTNVTITASPVSPNQLLDWVVNGVSIGDTNPLVLTLTKHINVKAVFATVFNVTSNADTDVTGTLRHAFDNAQDEDIIRVNLPASSVITLSSELYTEKNITMEGNGVTITTTVNAGFISIYNEGTLTIKRVWFKNCVDRWDAIVFNGYGGILTLESCVFSGNNAQYLIRNSYSTLNINGCTFYDNTGEYNGVIYTENNGRLNLTGNIFYDNKLLDEPFTCPAVRNNNSTVISNGYNVYDYSGWTTVGTDLQISESPFSSTTTLTPTTAIRNLIPAGAWAQANMPAVDFNGVTRNWTSAGAPGAVE